MAITGTLLSIWLFAKKVGKDEFGNKYYLSRCLNAEGKQKRIILYKGVAEPSKIPPMWHSWLHYKTDTLPKDGLTHKWQIKRSINMTGTDFAYMPPGHVSKGFKHANTTNDYQSWQP